MNFLRTLLAGAASVMLVAGAAYAQKIETRNPGTFDVVRVEGPFEATLRHGDTYSVEIDAPSDMLADIRTEVTGGRLTIRIKDGEWNWRRYRDQNLRVRITMPTLSAIDLAGSGDVVSSEVWKAERLKLGVSGSGSIRLQVETDQLTSSIAGSGNISVNGTSNWHKVAIAGSGDVQAADLQAKDVEISIAGSGDADVWANESIKASIAGSGDVRYKGKPSKVNVSSAGSGTIHSY